MALIRCASVDEGLRPSESTVTIQEYDGSHQFLPIDRAVLSHRNGSAYLSVSVIHLDDAKEAALVGLPVEADSGAHRIWVKYGDFAENPSPRELAK